MDDDYQNYADLVIWVLQLGASGEGLMFAVEQIQAILPEGQLVPDMLYRDANRFVEAAKPRFRRPRCPMFTRSEFSTQAGRQWNLWAQRVFAEAECLARAAARMPVHV